MAPLDLFFALVWTLNRSHNTRMTLSKKHWFYCLLFCFQSLRCERMIPPGPPGASGCQVVLCTFCTSKRFIFSPHPHQTKDSCPVCGNFVPAIMHSERTVARLCQWHAPHTAPGVQKCYGCGQMVQGRPLGPPTQCHLCMTCSARMSHCCKLLVEWRNPILEYMGHQRAKLCLCRWFL